MASPQIEVQYRANARKAGGWASFSSQNKNNSEISTIERVYIVQHFDIKLLMLAHGQTVLLAHYAFQK